MIGYLDTSYLPLLVLLMLFHDLLWHVNKRISHWDLYLLGSLHARPDSIVHWFIEAHNW